jgi:hypothetical protein
LATYELVTTSWESRALVPVSTVVTMGVPGGKTFPTSIVAFCPGLPSVRIPILIFVPEARGFEEAVGLPDVRTRGSGGLTSWSASCTVFGVLPARIENVTGTPLSTARLFSTLSNRVWSDWRVTLGFDEDFLDLDLAAFFLLAIYLPFLGYQLPAI